MLDAMRKLAREEAIFAEPAGATGYAGLAKAMGNGIIEGDEQIVVVITGNGLKDVPSAVRAAGKAPVIEPKLESVPRI
jgi:threonine synthase